MLNKRVSYRRDKDNGEVIGFTVVFKAEENSPTTIDITSGQGQVLGLVLEPQDVAALAEMASEARYATSFPAF
jgi:hypothetical protein